MSTDILARQPASIHQLGRALEVVVAKTRANLPDMLRQPSTWSVAIDGDYTKWDEDFFAIGNWTNGFFAGMGVLAWEHSGDDFFLEQLEALKPLFQAKLEGENAKNTMHDLGFLYSPYAVALYKKTGDPCWRDLALKAANLLAGRYIERGGYFRAWGRMDEIGTDYDGLAIIDCLMNMPLLFWASEETGDQKYHEMAVRHTDTTLENFVRSDWSVRHAFRFDSETGKPAKPDNYCGYHPESHWARGTTWAMYGFALAYRHTADEQYLTASQNITRKFISCLDEEVVPLWDFRLSADSAPLRDSSAAAIAACAIQELEELEAADAEMIATKHQLINRMLSPDYFNPDPAVRGFLKHGEIGDGADEARHFYRAKNAYTSWGDYYLMEALGRELGLTVNWW
jgi:unsaturated chondroitin disaccharide hydrolase